MAGQGLCYFLFLLSCLLIVTVGVESGVTYEQCPILNLNGLVFPEYSRRPVEHALHWSKAQSNISVVYSSIIVVIS